MRSLRSPRSQFVLSLIAATGVSVLLYLYGAWRNHSWHYAYLVWNLTLAWVPLLMALLLHVRLRHKLWSSWECIGLSLAWLLFLPNSFYLITDFIHLRDTTRVDVLYDALTFTSFIYTGVILGYASLYVVHRQLIRRLGRVRAWWWVQAVLVLCSGAIYIGRDLRWNSWDVITNPGGLLFDVADRVQHPAAYPQMLLIIVTVFVLLSVVYTVLHKGIAALRGLDG